VRLRDGWLGGVEAEKADELGFSAARRAAVEEKGVKHPEIWKGSLFKTVLCG